LAESDSEEGHRRSASCCCWDALSLVGLLLSLLSLDSAEEAKSQSAAMRENSSLHGRPAIVASLCL
jgi:hypothetical protein